MRTAKLSLVTIVLAIIASIFGSSMQSATAATPASSSATVQTSTATSTKHTSTAAASAKSGSTKATSSHNVDANVTTTSVNPPRPIPWKTKSITVDNTRSMKPMTVNNNSPPSGSIPGTVSVTAPSYAKSSSSAVTTATIQASATTAGKIQGEFISSTGYHPSKPAAKYTHYIKTGTWYQNSFRNRNGALQYFNDRCGAGSPYTHPLTSGSHKGYCVFYYDTHLHVWRKPDCGNYVKFSGTPAKYYYTSIILYKSFANVYWHDSVNLTEAGHVAATASCVVVYNGQTVVSGSATSSATASLTITVTVTVAAKYSTTAKASGTGHVSSSQWLSLASQVSAKGQLSIKATAQATCYYVPPVPPSCQPGQTGQYPNCITPCPPPSTGPGNGNCTYPPTCPSGSSGHYPYCSLPAIAASASGCAGYGGSSIVSGNLVNGNSVAITADLELLPGGQSLRVLVPVGQSVSFSFPTPVTTPGAYNVKLGIEEYGFGTTYTPLTVAQCTPTVAPPSVISVFQPQNVKVNAHFTTCTNQVSVPTGRTATLTISAHIGAIDSATKVQHITGQSGPITVCFGYTAPGEVGNDVIKFHIQDDQDSTLFADASTDSFPIQTPPVSG